MNKLQSYLLLILFCSCFNRENDIEIEIYFVKNRILSDEGILLKETKEYKKFRLDTTRYYFTRQNEKFDTISKQVIYGGEYKVSEADLETEPFIKDNEILILNKDNSQILLNDSGYRKLQNLKYKTDNGKQYVITVNKKPVLNGYLTSGHSSTVHSYNYLVFNDTFDGEKPVENHPLEISCTNSYVVFSKSSKTDLNKYPALVKAFEKTNRLKIKPTGNSGLAKELFRNYLKLFFTKNSIFNRK